MNYWSLNNEKIGHHAGFTDIAFFLALTLHMKKATWASSHPSHSSLDGRFIFFSTGNLWARVCSWKCSNRLTRHAPAASTPAPAGRSTHREVTSLKWTPFIHKQCGNSRNPPPPPKKKTLSVWLHYGIHKREAGTSSMSFYINLLRNKSVITDSNWILTSQLGYTSFTVTGRACDSLSIQVYSTV